MQSGELEVTGANILGTVSLHDQVVYTLGTYGAGRFIGTADSNVTFREETDCSLWAWLSARAEVTGPEDLEILLLGWTVPESVANGAPMESVGVHLPPMYVDNPAQLAADYDVVAYFESSYARSGTDQPSDAEMQTLLDYAFVHGKGLYLSSEYSPHLNTNDLASVNRLFVPLGLRSLEVSLNWGGASGEIEFACFPAPAG